MFKVSDLQVEDRQLNLFTWGELEDRFLQRVGRPHTVIEVGSYLGASAVKWASIAERVICVDTWLGSYEHYNGIPRAGNGSPDIYDTFLSNMVKCGVADKVEVIRLPSSIAFEVLYTKGIRADLVYLDGDHSFNGTAMDIQNYRLLVKDGGLISGDDYGLFEVKPAVDDSFPDGVELLGRYWVKQL